MKSISIRQKLTSKGLTCLLDTSELDHIFRLLQKVKSSNV